MAFPSVDDTEVLALAPEGYHVNFTHPTYDSLTIRSSYWAFGVEFPIAVLFLAQRVYTSGFILRKFRVDDYMIVLAWMLTTTAQCLILRCLTQGILGVHIWEISLDKAIFETTLIHATTLTVIPGTVLAKLVLCIFYYRLAPITWYRYMIILTGLVTVATFAAVWFAVEFACKPIEAAWNLRLYTGDNCIDRPPVYMLQAVMGGVTDILLMALPLPTILGLQMPWKHKMALLCWFGTGLLTLGVAIARLIILNPSLRNSDTTCVLAQGKLWLIVEANLIIICGSLPTFRIFLNHVAPKVLGDSKSPSTGSRDSKPQGGVLGGNGFRYALRTFGRSQARRRHFDTIDDIMNESDVSEYQPEHGHSATWGGSSNQGRKVVHVVHEVRESGVESDEEAIMSTTGAREL
ncbi:hypothetical protein F4778DRAFT_766190 [Xylariomycetidae sp. FL2044]|nr:hypothetical protein F4778DRAFT_766190 [Xylariomycetidae sp. FL2044]